MDAMSTPRADGRLLVVDDEPVARQLIGDILKRAGYEVVATDIELEVSDAPAVEAAVAGAAPVLLVHLAAVSFVPDSRAEPERTYRVNFLGTRAVLEAAARAAPEARVLLACSGDQYGSAALGEPPFTETSPQRPRSPYAHTKVAADLLGACYAARGLDVVRSRAFNHTGPGQADGFVLPSFARQAVEISLGRREPVMRVGKRRMLLCKRPSAYRSCGPAMPTRSPSRTER